MNTKLRTPFAMLLGLILISPMPSPLLWAAEHTPIIDVHMHSEYEPSTFLPGGPPFHMCHETYDIVDPTPNTKPGDPVSLEDIFHCRDKAMVSTMTDEENQQKMFEMFEKYNYKLAIDSGTNFARMADWAQKSPVKLLPALLLWKQSPSPEETRKLIEAGKIKVMGEIAVQYDGLAPNDPFLDPYWALAVEYDIPAAIHIGQGAPGGDYIGYHTKNEFRSDLTDPLILEEVLRKHKGLRVYVMHYGWPMVDKMLLLMYMHPEVYVDIGMNDWNVPRKEFYRNLQTLVEAGFGKRIMFGTDTPVWPAAIQESVDAIDEAPFLTEEQKQDIFYNNAMRFFRWTEADLKK